MYIQKQGDSSYNWLVPEPFQLCVLYSFPGTMEQSSVKSIYFGEHCIVGRPLTAPPPHTYTCCVIFL